MAKTYIPDEVKAKEWLEEHGFQITEDNKLDIYGIEEVMNNAAFEILGFGRLRACVNSPITELPDFLFCFDDLVDLTMKNMNINTIPESICNLTSLKTLHMSSCGLEKIPESVGGLTSLEGLSILSNMIKELPDSICNLENLKYLVISSNDFSELPEPISNLSSLTALNFNDNPITEIPDWIINLTSLRVINCSNCNISTIPDYMTYLTSLNSLKFDGNNIPGVPSAGGHFHKIWLEYKPCHGDPGGELSLCTPKLKKIAENIDIPCKIGKAELALDIHIYPDVNINLGDIISRSTSLLEIDENIKVSTKNCLNQQPMSFGDLTFDNNIH